MATTTCLELTVPARPGGHPPKNIRLCVSEAVTNVARHAYEPDDGDVDVRVELSEVAFRVVVRDEGKGLAGRRHPNGPGFRIIDALADRYVASSGPRFGTEVSMTFALDRRKRVRF